MGVSTRGFGVGVGPLSAGSGWGRRRRSKKEQEQNAEAFGWLIGGSILLAWPYVLGSWLASSAGASAAGQAATAWTLEVIWLALLVLGGVGHLLQKRKDRLAADQAAREREEADWQAGHHAIRAFRQWLAHPPRGGELPHSVSGMRGERLLGTLHEASLVQPRVATRGGPRMPSVVDHGRVLITTERVLFFGESKTLTWDLRNVARVTANPERHYVALATTNRQTVSGLLTDTATDYVRVRLATAWALDQRGGDGTRMFTEALRTAPQELADAL